MTEAEIKAELKRLSEILEIEEERRKIIDPVIARCKENRDMLIRFRDSLVFNKKEGE